MRWDRLQEGMEMVTQGFRLEDMCEAYHGTHPIGAEKRPFECYDRSRRSDDDHVCTLSFEMGTEVQIQPTALWFLGRAGRTTWLMVKRGRGWDRLRALE